jgi:hypothetical protein
MILSLKIQKAGGAARPRPDDIELVIRTHGHYIASAAAASSPNGRFPAFSRTSRKGRSSKT